MAEYIKREDVIEAIASGDPTNGWENIFCGRALIGMITKIPAADVVERKIGKWIRYSVVSSLYYCSVCNSMPRDITNFCPNCGADMRGEQDE